MTTPDKRIIAVLDFPARPRDAIVRGDAITSAYQANETTLLAGCSPTPAALIALINDLRTAEVAAEQKVRGAAAIRNAKYKACKVGFIQFTASVQTRMDANPAIALQIAQAALLYDRKSSNRQKNTLGAEPVLGHSGAVELTAPAAAKGVQRTQFWQISTDGEKTWTDLQPSHKSIITVTNLTPGSTVVFRHRFLEKEVMSDWSQHLTVLVH